ncbi:hypothetical protein NDU88_007310 [Pleurodeles waltl]|uniref:Uncharacterized protein n=1 Tax=Pleurodeles waltl TaxID=8319 RepID=A0AAV7RPX4_PLEWA|nr:hypothetical protein NDU88_007310 [Pleurodeles waltl]
MFSPWVIVENSQEMSDIEERAGTRFVFFMDQHTNQGAKSIRKYFTQHLTVKVKERQRPVGENIQWIASRLGKGYHQRLELEVQERTMSLCLAEHIEQGLDEKCRVNGVILNRYAIWAWHFVQRYLS